MTQHVRSHVPCARQLGAGLAVPGVVAAKAGAGSVILSDSERATPGVLALGMLTCVVCDMRESRLGDVCNVNACVSIVACACCGFVCVRASLQTCLVCLVAGLGQVRTCSKARELWDICDRVSMRVCVRDGGSIVVQFAKHIFFQIRAQPRGDACYGGGVGCVDP